MFSVNYTVIVQILTFLARKDPEWYELARETSTGVQEFEAPDDICRQYLYRCQLETDAGDFRRVEVFG